MGTYALSAGYYDAYYKRAQQVGAGLCCTICPTAQLLSVALSGPQLHALVAATAALRGEDGPTAARPTGAHAPMWGGHCRRFSLRTRLLDHAPAL